MRLVKIIAAIVIFGAAAYAILILVNPDDNKISNETVQTPSPEVLGVPEGEGGVDIKIGEIVLNAQFIKVENSQNITLIGNFEEKKTSQDILKEKGCKNLVSGGFYTKDDKPTGLFVSEKSQVKGFVASSLLLLNSIFSVNDFETARITKNVPKDPLRLAVQAGPLLKENGNKLDFASTNDSGERRVAVGVTGENETVFMVFYDPKSVFLGPKLKDLPLAVEIFEEETGIKLADAMNFDGGSASAFITQDFSLKELSPLGSYFCIK